MKLNSNFLLLEMSKKKIAIFILLLILNHCSFDDKTGNSIKPAEDGTTEYQKPFEINPMNTLIFPRGLGTLGFTTNRRWVDMVKILEYKGFKTIPSLETWDLCTSKYYCSELFKNNGLKTTLQALAPTP